ncbi:hypothetical protein VYU27_002973 [Nannochloropsis oceanica]
MLLLLLQSANAFQEPAFVAARRGGVGRRGVMGVAGQTMRRRIGALRASSSLSSSPKRVIFLGTPDVAALSLSLLLTASKEGRGGNFSIISVVTQPPAPSGRKLKLTPSPVQTLAESAGLPVLTPDKAKDPAFLSTLQALQPDLCITAAYGNFLPSSFLALPRFGTLNIHPSLLPKYRGASPVQRTLQAGDAMTGVSVLFTELKMDAGPILRQVGHPLEGEEKAPELLRELFAEGTEALIQALPSVWDGTATPQEQVEEQATKANKITAAEAGICFEKESARTIHNKVRGFAGWPGTWAWFELVEEEEGGKKSDEIVRLKIVTTRVVEQEGEGRKEAGGRGVELVGGKTGCLRVVCGDESVLDLLEVQPPGKKVMDSKSYANGLRGRTLRWRPMPKKEVEEGVEGA